MIEKHSLEKRIKEWLMEDMPFGDITTEAVVAKERTGEGFLIAKEEGVICGMDVYKQVYAMVDAKVALENYVCDGDFVKKGDKIAKVSGPMSGILQGERLGLNLMQRMSGIASTARKYSEKVEEYPTRVVDTRKTTPGLRDLEKYAVHIGGGHNHRYSLSDAVMIKDNHIAANDSIKEAVKKAKLAIPHTMKVEIEVENLEEYEQALEAGADIIMLDNMSLEDMRKAVQKRQMEKRNVILEASGNMTLDRITDVAKTGVDVISVGALTHSVTSMDISLKFEK